MSLALALKSDKKSVRAGALQEIAGMPEYADTVVAMLEDKEIVVQAQALTALGSMGVFGDEIVAKLESSEKEVQKAAIAALGLLGDAAHVETVENFLENKDLDLVAVACVALGNLKATGSSGKVASKLQSGDSDVVCAACAGLAMMDAEVAAVGKVLSAKDARAKAAALNALSTMTGAEKSASAAASLIGDGDGYVRVAAVCLFTTLGEKASGEVKAIGKFLGNGDVGTRTAAAAALAGIGEKAASESSALEKLLDDAGEDFSTTNLATAGVQNKLAASYRKPNCAAALALGLSKSAGSAEKLAAGLSSEDSDMRAACAVALGDIGEEAVKFEDALGGLLEDSMPYVVVSACQALGSIGSKNSGLAAKVAELIPATYTGHAAVRAAAVTCLGKMGDLGESYLDEIVKCFADQIWSVRAAAIGAVGSCGEAGQMYASEVCRLMYDDNVNVRLAAVESLAKMGERGSAFAEEVEALQDDPTEEIRAASLKALGDFKAFGSD